VGRPSLAAAGLLSVTTIVYACGKSSTEKSAAGPRAGGGGNAGLSTGGSGGAAQAGTRPQAGTNAGGAAGATGGEASGGAAGDGAAGEGAAGEGGRPAFPPPVVFTTRSNPAIEDLESLATNGEVIVATGTSMLIYSEDGVTWQAPSPLVPAYHVAFGNGRFVATGYEGRAFVSSDGRSWTETGINATGATDLGFYRISYGFGRFFATNVELDPGTYVTTTDGVSWTLVTVQPPSVGSLWSRVVETSAAGNLLFMSSESLSAGNFVTRDGNTWEQLPNWFSMFYDATHDGQTYCLGAAMLPSVASADGENWTRGDNGLPSYGVTHRSGVFYAVSIEGYVFASYDCLEWGPGAEPPLPRYFDTFPFNLRAIRTHKDRLVIAARNGTIYTSP
jgi:hypothetical protein